MRKLVEASLVGAALAIALVGCGNGSNGGNQAITTYELTAEPDSIRGSNEGSFITLKTPPWGPTGIRSGSGITGSFEVVEDTPSAGVALDYRVVRFNFVPLESQPIDRNVDSISAEGDDLGHLRLLDDGTLTMTLVMPTELFGGLTFNLGSYDQRPNRYEMQDGKLLLRGVRLNTIFDEPYFGSPLVYLWADPVSD